MLELLQKQLDAKGKLRAQLLEKQQALLTLGLTVCARMLQFRFLRTNVDQLFACLLNPLPAAVEALLQMPRSGMPSNLHRLHRRLAQSS